MDNPKYDNYYKETRRLIKFLERYTDDSQLLSQAQVQLDRLAERYQYDAGLGADTYLLYQIQAMIHYRFNNYEQAELWIRQAMDTYGGNYDFADEFLAHLSVESELPFVDYLKLKVFTILIYILVIGAALIPAFMWQHQKNIVKDAARELYNQSKGQSTLSD